MKFREVSAAIRLPKREDFALAKSEKKKKRVAAINPIVICDKKIPTDSCRGLEISISIFFGFI